MNKGKELHNRIGNNRVTLWDLLCRKYFDESYYVIADTTIKGSEPKWDFLYHNWNDVVTEESVVYKLSLVKFEEKYKLRFKLTPPPGDLT